jgi:pSer/pThr/pTyr-binding forkhead associated (FHA) protein
MPTLTLVMDRTPIHVYEMQRPIIQIGRAEGMEIVIDNVSVSRRQAELRQDRHHWTVRDLESSNGTFLNGVRLTEPQRLKRGDEISFGKFSLFFEREFDEPLAEAMIVPEAATKAHPPGTYHLGTEDLERLQHLIVAKRKAHLEWAAAGTTGTHFIGESVLVGPQEGCQLRIAAAPRKGILITRGRQGFEAHNLASWFDFAWMRVNGKVTRRAALKTGDRIDIGRVRLTFRDEVR